VQAYLQALSAKDSAKLANCPARPGNRRPPWSWIRSRRQHHPERGGLQGNRHVGSDTLVTCSGQIVASYNGENQNLALSGRTYQVVQEGGEWRYAATIEPAASPFQPGKTCGRLVLCLIVIAVIVLTAGSQPLWIYQVSR